MVTRVCLVKHTCFILVCISLVHDVTACKDGDWRKMTMEELLLKSDVVVYGKDVQHGKLRLPTTTDARFDVYCVIKKGRNIIPGQVVIEGIYEADACSGVNGQTDVGKEYIIGLTRELSGFMSYAKINPLQKTAFPPTIDNFNKLSAACDLDEWSIPATTSRTQGTCPVANKPLFCTKIRDPTQMNGAPGINIVSLWHVLIMAFLLLIAGLE